MHPASAPHFNPPLLSHQSMQYKPLCMQLVRQTDWRWLQFSALIAFCREASRALQLSMTSWHINTYQCVCILYTQTDISAQHTTEMHALTQHTDTHILHNTTETRNCIMVGQDFSINITQSSSHIYKQQRYFQTIRKDH